MHLFRMTRIGTDKRLIRRILQRARERLMSIPRQSQSLCVSRASSSSSSTSLRAPIRVRVCGTYLSSGNQLDQLELLQRLELYSRGHDGRAPNANLEKVLCLIPPPQRGERYAADVVVFEVVEVGEVREGRVDVGDGCLENGEGDGEVACGDAGLGWWFRGYG